MKKLLKNLWLYVFLYFIASLIAIGWVSIKPTNKIVKVIILKTEMSSGQKIPLFKKEKPPNLAIKKKV